MKENNQKLSVQLFELLKIEFKNVFNNIKNFDQINILESFIKDYLWYVYLRLDNNLNKDVVIDLIRGSKVEIDDFDTSNIIDKNPLSSFQYIVSTSLLTIILLYKKGYLIDMGHNPLNFVNNIIKSILPEGEKFSDLGDKSIDIEIRELLNNIHPKDWYQINQKPLSETLLFYWSSFDNDKILDNLNLQSIIKELEIPFRDRYKTHLKLDIQKTESYNDFFKLLDIELQNRFKRPDIFFLDTTLIAEYKSKGIIFPFASICKEENYIKFYEDEIFEIGKTLNGVLDSFPISRNFHLPAKPANSDLELDLTKNNNISDLTKHLDENIDNWINKLEGDTEEPNQKTLYSKIGNHKFPNYKDNGYLNLLIEIENNCFIPMQLARGAHIAYTSFAYMANCCGEQSSLISIGQKKDGEKNIEISIYNIDLIRDRFDFFFKLIFAYVPVISLTLDHIYSGYLRDLHKTRWFDLCLPIEAAKFQIEEIEFFNEPFLTETNKPLSCIGGYTLSISHDCNNPQNVAEIIKTVSKEYFISPLKYEAEGFELKKLKDINCRLKPKDLIELTDYIDQNDLNKFYIDTPKDLAKRPNFVEWKNIENIISDVVRLHILILFIFRQYLYAKKCNKNLIKKKSNKDGTSMYINEDEIKIYIENFKSIILAYYNQSIKLKNKEQDHKRWVDNNFDNYVTEELYIKEIVNKLIKLFVKDSKIVPCLKELSKRTSEVLYNKITSFCHFNNYDIKDI